MSSVASQRAMLIALGGFSIAALFIWYVQSQKDDEEKKKKKEALTSTAKDSVNEKMKKHPVEETAEKKVATPVASASAVNEPIETIPAVDQRDSVNGDMGCVGTPVDRTTISEKSDEVINHVVGPAGDCAVRLNERPADDAAETESQNDGSSGGRSVSEGDYDIEEPVVCERTNELLLDISHNPVEHEQFSWSEEMERSYVEQQLEQNRNDMNERYAQSESPGASENSEVSSQDSGRATGGLASSLSPMDDGNDNNPMYEFEIPNSLVGLVIGIKGKTIKELSTRTNVKMLIRQHHTPEKVNTHQICQVRGKREEINKCLHMLRSRFPTSRFPDLNLQPVLPPPLPHHVFDAMSAQPCWLTLPELVPCEVIVSCATSPGHFFLQQPTHPSFSSLNHLDLYMLSLYSRGGSTIPELPKPCQTGLLCAAPVLNAWFRAVTHAYYEDTDEVLVRFVDYGGYTTVPRSELRQIRTDLMSLPFQSTECYLAHVQPVDGTWNWGATAEEFFRSKCLNKLIHATLVGLHADDKIHMVEVTFTDDDGKVQRLDRLLMDAGLAKASDPSKLARANPLSGKRPSLKPQTSVLA